MRTTKLWKFTLISALATVLFLKVLAYPKVFENKLWSDEVYYIMSARNILYSLGLRSTLYIPFNSTIASKDSTVFINISVAKDIGNPPLLGVWEPHPLILYNVEHPFFAKTLYLIGILLYGDNWLGWRFFPLLFLYTSIFLLLYLAISKHGLPGIGLVSILFAVDSLFICCGSRAYLDGVGVGFTLLSYLMLLRRKYMISSIFLGLASASKEVFLVYTIPTTIVMLGRKLKRRTVLTYNLTVLGFLFLGYFPSIILGLFFSTAFLTQLKHFALMRICPRFTVLQLLTNSAPWNECFYSNYLTLVALFSSSLTIAYSLKKRLDSEKYLSSLFFISFIGFITLVSFVRCIYPFYFINVFPFALLSILELADVSGFKKRLLENTGLANVRG